MSRNMNGYIPFSEMKSYIELYGIKDQSRFIRMIQAMDKVYADKAADNGDK